MKHIRDLSAGNGEAYDYLFLRYYPKVNRFIENLVKSSEVAKDLSQDIFIKIWTNRQQLAGIESFNSYIFRVAKNAALNYIKHLETRLKYELRQQYESRESMEDEIETRDLETAIRSIVESMPEQRRRVFNLSREQYLKNKEIMDIMNISEKTVKNHLTLALRDIKRALFIIITILLQFD